MPGSRAHLNLPLGLGRDRNGPWVACARCAGVSAARLPLPCQAPLCQGSAGRPRLCLILTADFRDATLGGSCTRVRRARERGSPCPAGLLWSWSQVPCMSPLAPTLRGGTCCLPFLWTSPWAQEGRAGVSVCLLPPLGVPASTAQFGREGPDQRAFPSCLCHLQAPCPQVSSLGPCVLSSVMGRTRPSSSQEQTRSCLWT